MFIRILVDADACPSKQLIEEIAREEDIALIFYCCLSSIFSVEYGEVIYVDQGFQMVDMKIVNNCKKGDIVITQDYGVATMVLGKGCYAINPRGFIYNEDNIDEMLMQRYITTKVRRGGGKVKGFKKRSSLDEERLYINLKKLIKSKIKF